MYTELWETVEDNGRKISIRIRKFSEQDADIDIARLEYDHGSRIYMQSSRDSRKLGHVDDIHVYLKQVCEDEKRRLAESQNTVAHTL